MKKISHSEISTYTDCQKKWELQYSKGLRMSNVHFEFGNLGHKVLENGIIPDEELYVQLKEYFGIKSWNDYFKSIYEELNMFLKDYIVLDKEVLVENDYLKGFIDLVLKNEKTNKILLIDYKFSTSNKGQEDLLLDEQLYIYSLLYSKQFNIPIDNISVGYISIPKTQLDKPRLLKNGKLSKDKNQNTTYNKYIEAIKELNQDINDYQDILEQLSGKTLLNISITEHINLDMLERIVINIDNIFKDMQKGYTIEKCSFMCKNCDYLQYCKYNKPIKGGD